MDLETVKQSKASQKEINKYYVLTNICRVWKKWYKLSYLLMQSRNRDTDVKKCMITKRESRVGMNWEIGVEIDWLPWWFSGKEFTCQCRRSKFNPQVRKSPWRKKWQLTPVSLPGNSHGHRSMAGYSSWGCKRFRHNLATKQQKQ